MANNPYNRTPLYPLEKPLCDEVNQGFSQVDRSIRDTLFALLNGRQGFLKDGFLVSQSSPAALSVLLKAGVGFQDAAADVPSAIDGVVGLDDLSRYKPIILGADLTVAVPTPPGADSRIDLLEVRYNRNTNNPQSRNFLNPATNAFAPANVDKTLDFNVDGTLAYYAAAAVPTTALAYKSGVAAGSPVAPAVDTGYMALARITVAAGVVTIVTANIEVARAVVDAGLYLGESRTRQFLIAHKCVMEDAAVWTVQSGGLLSTAAAIAYCSPEMEIGERITSITFSTFGNAGADMDVQVNLVQDNGTITNKAAVTLTNPPASWATTTLVVTPTTLGVGDTISVKFNPNATGIVIKNLTYTTDHPHPVV